jgi:hypothetical protein
MDCFAALAMTLMDRALPYQLLCLAQTGHPVRHDIIPGPTANVYWIIRRSLSSGGAKAPTRWRMMTLTPYLTTAAVWPNSSLRSSSVRIAGWPKFGLISFAMA